MLEYTDKNGWKEIEDFLSGDDEFTEELSNSGFYSFPIFSLGVSEGYQVEIYSRSIGAPNKAKSEFLAMVDVGSIGYAVALPRVQDYIAFINHVSPGLKNVTELINLSEPE